MKDCLTVTKALADENRLRILLALRGGELCACQLIELLGLAPSTVSKHLALLKQAGLVELRKDGRWAYYRLAGRRTPPMARRALRWVLEVTAASDRARRDEKRLARIRKIDREKLCRKLERK